MTGQELNEKWKIGARQARYGRDGNWFSLLDQFPGALCDRNGYILFPTREEYESCTFLQRVKQINVPGGIQRIPGYVWMTSEMPPRTVSGVPNLEEIITEINLRAGDHPVGQLQTLRADLKGKRRPVSPSAERIFREARQHPSGDFAFHFGGGSELQFNVGFESDKRELRHGVAFSFEPSINKPWADLYRLLAPKALRFNKFMALNPECYSDMGMWYAYKNLQFGVNEIPASIPLDRMKKGMFIMLGSRQRTEHIDYDAILADMDRLLPLYFYVEDGGAIEPTPIYAARFVFSSQDWRDRPAVTVATHAEQQIDIALRHNELQKTLYHRLVSQHGESNVTYESPSGAGTRIDVIVQRDGEYWYYEIKTAQSPRVCIREAIGQLLEYGFWPGAPTVTKLVVVGEFPIDKDGAEYLRRLRDRFSLPLEYEQAAVHSN